MFKGFSCGPYLCRTALAGIVTLLHACLDMKPIILGKYHYVLYFLVLAMQVSSTSVLCFSLLLVRSDELAMI